MMLLNILKMYYLMIKTHNISGLKYLCKMKALDIKDCFVYLGSGKYWKRHLSKHGRDISTEILEKCETKEELKEKGIYWSRKLKVVESEEYANLVEERGDGGPTMLGRSITPEQNKRKSIALKEWWLNASTIQKENRRDKNSKCHEKYRYYTPFGIFTNAFEAGKVCSCSNVTIINRCIKDTNKKIFSKKYWKFGWKNKTWKELGWYGELLSA